MSGSTWSGWKDLSWVLSFGWEGRNSSPFHLRRNVLTTNHSAVLLGESYSWLVLLRLSYHEVMTQSDSKPGGAWLYSLVVRTCPWTTGIPELVFSPCNHFASKSHWTEDRPCPTEQSGFGLRECFHDCGKVSLILKLLTALLVSFHLQFVLIFWAKLLYS